MIYTYDPTLNPAHRAPTEDDPEPTWTPDAIPGVPLRDLDEADLRALPRRLRASIAACPFYVVADAGALAALLSELDPPTEEPLGGAAEPARRRRMKTAEEV